MINMNPIEHGMHSEVKQVIKNVHNEEDYRIQELKLDFDLVSVGIVETVFNRKNGTPRQSGICPQSKGVVRLHKKLFNNPNHALEGIEQFQYVWIIYYFHENTNKRRFNAKVRPPRLNGASCGVFACRAPHRPNPLGLTLAKIDHVQDGLLYISGIDIIDGTPIVDIKPYIEKYDNPLLDKVLLPNPSSKLPNSRDNPEETKADLSSENAEDKNSTVPSGWVDGSVVSDIEVDFTSRSLSQLSKFHNRAFHSTPDDSECDYCFRMFDTQHEAKQAIENLLQADPRSTYRRTKCVDRLYFFTLDSIHITAWFDYECALVEIVKIKPFINKK